MCGELYICVCVCGGGGVSMHAVALSVRQIHYVLKPCM